MFRDLYMIQLVPDRYRCSHEDCGSLLGGCGCERSLILSVGMDEAGVQRVYQTTVNQHPNIPAAGLSFQNLQCYGCSLRTDLTILGFV